MPPEDYEPPLDGDAMYWIARLADMGLISEDQFLDLAMEAYA